MQVSIRYLSSQEEEIALDGIIMSSSDECKKHFPPAIYLLHFMYEKASVLGFEIIFHCSLLHVLEISR